MLLTGRSSDRRRLRLASHENVELVDELARKCF